MRSSSIKGKTGLIILLFFILYGAFSYGIQRATIYPYFQSLEFEEAHRNLFRALEMIYNEVDRIESLCRDWASWNDALNFIENKSDEHFEKHLLPKTFYINRINLLLICDEAGSLIWWDSYDLVMEQPVAADVSDALRNQILAASPLFSADPDTLVLSASGVLIAEPYSVLVSSHPVIWSGSEGEICGYMVFGRFLTPELIDEFEELAEIDFDIVAIDEEDAASPFRQIADQINPGNPQLIQAESDSFLHAYAAAPDIFGRKALLIASKMPGKIIGAGKRTMLYAMASMLIAGVFIFFGLRLILQRVIVTPISRLTNRMIQVGKTGDLSARLSTDRQDEIGVLGKEFDGMLEKLEKKDNELVGANAKLEEEINERQRLINELQQALSEVKTLSGLLPICANCKKIRDDKGYWNQIESYLHKHSEAKFSHGMCPDCLKQLYPDIYDEKYLEGNGQAEDS